MNVIKESANINPVLIAVAWAQYYRWLADETSIQSRGGLIQPMACGNTNP